MTILENRKQRSPARVGIMTAGVNPSPAARTAASVRPRGCDRAGARDYEAFLGFFSLDPS